jgi:hypothetical protein
MQRTDVEGAIAAAQYFLELYPYAYNTGDLTEWRAMSHPECIFCASVIENVEELHARGGYEVGGEFVFKTVAAREPLPDNEFFAVDFLVEQEAGARVVANEQPASFPASQNNTFFAISRGPGGWVVREVTVKEVP